jgi:peptidoglycan/LPS O-acetylase OafA/YrhL
LLPQKIIVLGINVGFLFRFGSEAVIVFFILSGFVIKYSWEKSADKSFKNYFFRRFTRIYIPLFFIFTSLWYKVTLKADGQIQIGTLLGNILCFRCHFTKTKCYFSGLYGNGVLWSLSYEWWFYMLLSFYLKVSESKINLWVTILTIAATVSYLVYPFFLIEL